MALFINVYIRTFARVTTPLKLVQQVLALPDGDREEFVRLLRNSLKI